jgi:hypothetical protein
MHRQAIRRRCEKRLEGVNQGMEEFLAEVRMIGRIHQLNLVRLTTRQFTYSDLRLVTKIAFSDLRLVVKNF